MTLENIKTKIESREPIKGLIIFKYSDSDFIPHQYIAEYLNYSELNVEVIDELKDIPKFNLSNSSLYVLKTDKFSCNSEKYLSYDNLIIVCKSIDKKTEKIFSDCIVNVPKIEEWQILDYLYFNCPTVADKLKHVIKYCKGNMYAVENEISKISIFSKNASEIGTASADEKALPECIINMLNREGAWNYTTDVTIFDLIKALFTKDVEKIEDVYRSGIEIPPALFFTLVCSAIEDILRVTLDPMAQADRLNMPNGKFWAIKKTYSGMWNQSQLASLLQTLDGVDKLIKIGKLNFDDILTSYIIEKITELY